jgi:monoamine oxidase
MGPGGLSHIHNLRKAEKNIHFAGTEMATVSAGYMDGAIESGIRAAN